MNFQYPKFGSGRSETGCVFAETGSNPQSGAISRLDGEAIGLEASSGGRDRRHAGGEVEEVHVRFWESPEVKVLRATRRGVFAGDLTARAHTRKNSGRRTAASDVK
jgi:hypothetical protein